MATIETMASWAAQWNSIKGNFIGYVDNVNGDVDHLRQVVLNKYFSETNTKFVHNGCSSTHADLKTKRLHFWIKSGNEKVNLGGMPFMIMKNKFLECQYGSSKYIKKNKSDREDYLKNNHRTKIDCPAKINIVEIILFNDEKADITKEHAMKKLSRKIKGLICGGTAKFTKAYIFFLSKKDDHMPHDSAFKFRSHLDKRVRQKIKDLVSDGVRSADYIDLEVKIFVKTLFPDFLPSHDDRKFFPSKKSIKSYIHNDTLENNFIMDILSTVENNTSSDESQEDFHVSRINTTYINKAGEYGCSDTMDPNCIPDTISTVDSNTSSDESQEDYHMSIINTTSRNNIICNESQSGRPSADADLTGSGGCGRFFKEFMEVLERVKNISYDLRPAEWLEEDVIAIKRLEASMNSRLIREEGLVAENGCPPPKRPKC